ncbi:MAG: peptidase S8 [Clostridia bacterium]|nr:peptidase S8 [Clostridia bacterium]
MNNYLNKICLELLNVVQIKSYEIYNDCVVYAKNFQKLKIEAKKQGLKFYEYSFINAIGVTLSQKQIVKFAKISVVGFIAKQTRVSTQIDVAKKILNVKNLFENGYTGENVTVAFIDTGLNPHIDFCVPKNRVIKFVDLINDKKNCYDDNGHGTYVTSIACGSGLASGGKYSGVSPKSNIISIKALEQNGETGAYKILEAMQWISDNYKKYGIKVVCMSFGSNPLGKNDTLVVGAESLWNMGLVVVAAAGNSGPENFTIKSPGYSSKIITVGGFDDKRDENGNFDRSKFEIANFSSRGPAGMFFKPDLVAPAVNIKGAGFNKETKEFYVKMSGTSVATPIIAGICALIISKNPSLTPDRLKIKLINNCFKLTKNRNEEGFGVLDLTGFFN